jgi:preprotein translocase subunit SecF
MSFKLYTPNYKPLLILPAVLAVVFLFIVFVFPGVTLGLDFVGGTRIIASSDGLQAQPVHDLLANQLNLPEVKVTQVDGPLGKNTRIEYAEPKDVSDARALLEQGIEAKSKKDEAGAKSLFVSALAKLNVNPTSDQSVEGLLQQASLAVNEKSAGIANTVQQSLIQEFGIPADAPFTVEQVTPSFGARFLENTLFVALVSIFLLTIVIFIFFREVVPSLAVVEAALFDMLTAVALLTLFGFSITLSTVAALLMMVGYSIDTDILLTTRMLKRKDKTILERSNDTLLTGLTVTATLVGATLVMLIVSWYSQINIIYEIAATILFGLFGDIVATWFTNAPILLWHWEKKHGKLEASA